MLKGAVLTKNVQRVLKRNLIERARACPSWNGKVDGFEVEKELGPLNLLDGLRRCDEIGVRSAAGLFEAIVLAEESGVVASARIGPGRVDTGDGGAIEGYARFIEDVNLYGQIVEVIGLDARCRLDLDEGLTRIPIRPARRQQKIDEGEQRTCCEPCFEQRSAQRYAA
jgi:hypothetical protein